MCLWPPWEVLLKTLVLLSTIGTSGGQWLFCRINLSVDSTSNDAEDQCCEAWCMAEGLVYRFGCTGLEAADVLLKFITSKSAQVKQTLKLIS